MQHTTIYLEIEELPKQIIRVLMLQVDSGVLVNVEAEDIKGYAYQMLAHKFGEYRKDEIDHILANLVWVI